MEEVKLAIKPFYQRREVTKDEYKDILRKAVQKVGGGAGSASPRGGWCDPDFSGAGCELRSRVCPASAPWYSLPHLLCENWSGWVTGPLPADLPQQEP